MINYKEHSISDNIKSALVLLLALLTIFHVFDSIYTHRPDELIMRTFIAVILLTFLLVERMETLVIHRNNQTKLATLQRKLRENNLETIRSLALAEEARDPYTRGHSLRVSEFATLIARRLGLPDAEVRVLENASILHDVGKVGVADIILQKKGRLTSKEWRAVKRHPKLALNILAPLEFLSEEKEIIKHHHERFDGTGYPDGTKGEKIPLGSRIIAVSDAFDAMSSNRPYRAPLAKDMIISELSRSAGTQFDPELVNIALDIIKEKGLSL